MSSVSGHPSSGTLSPASLPPTTHIAPPNTLTCHSVEGVGVEAVSNGEHSAVPEGFSR